MSRMPRCLSCDYLLIGLSASRCPECGRQFDRTDPTTYTTIPAFTRWKFWTPGFLLVLFGGGGMYLLSRPIADLNAATTVAIPFCVGALVGYACRVGKFMLVVGAIALLSGFWLAVLNLDVTGLFCGTMMVAIASGPLLLGAACGWALRSLLKESNFDQRWHLPMLPFVLLLVC